MSLAAPLAVIVTVPPDAITLSLPNDTVMVPVLDTLMLPAVARTPVRAADTPPIAICALLWWVQTRRDLILTPLFGCMETRSYRNFGRAGRRA